MWAKPLLFHENWIFHEKQFIRNERKEWRDNIACVCFMNERKSVCTVSYANIYYEQMWFPLKGNNEMCSMAADQTPD